MSGTLVRWVRSLGAAAVLVLVVASACSQQPTAFCAQVARADRGFDADQSNEATLAAIDRLLVRLPAGDRADVRAVRDFLDVAANPGRRDAARVAGAVAEFRRALPRLDRRLRRECGVPLEGVPSLFTALAPGKVRP